MNISVIVVTLNAGNDLLKTVKSALSQKNAQFQVVIKDGGSTDGSVEQLPQDSRIMFSSCKDTGVYNAMNQASLIATGDYCIFMNTGDLFYDDYVLSKISRKLDELVSEEDVIFYGDCFTENRSAVLRYPAKFDDYVCFTMVLCHQATIYPTRLLRERQFSLEYRVAADYEYYVYAYTHGTRLVHLPITVARYKGDGMSETQKNRKKALKESSEIRKRYFPKERYWRTWAKAQFHGIGIKHFLVKQEWFYPVYKRIACMYYGLKNNRG